MIFALPPAAAVGALLAVDFNSTIGLGSIVVGVIVGIATLVGVIYGAQYKASYEAERSLAAVRGEELELERERHEQASRERKELQELAARQAETIVRLEALPNLERVVSMMSDTFTRIDERASQRLEHGLATVAAIAATHEDRAQERHQTLLAALIAVRDG